jgi:tRNA (guanine37-N1)-methyltransferase
MTWNVHILTLFPEVFPGVLGVSIPSRALKKGLLRLEVHNIRDFALDRHKTVDDTPFGGGAGMVMKADVLGRAIEHVKQKCAVKKVIYLSPRGGVFNQTKAVELTKQNDIAFICGRYEGIDHRVIEEFEIEEISVGDYILSGGELATQVIIDSCIRLIPGVLENRESLAEESFSLESEYEHLLEYPHYTKPRVWHGRKVPDVLCSGNHAKINRWRLQKSREVTEKNRPDLWKKYKLLLD